MSKQAILIIVAIIAITMLVGLVVVSATVVNYNYTQNVNSGVHIKVTIGPTCPVQRIDQPDQCADRPYSTNLVVKDVKTGQQVANAKSDDNGELTLKLIPGTYLIGPDQSGTKILPMAQGQTVMVRPNEFTDVKISFDSGIR